MDRSDDLREAIQATDRYMNDFLALKPDEADAPLTPENFPESPYEDEVELEVYVFDTEFGDKVAEFTAYKNLTYIIQTVKRSEAEMEFLRNHPERDPTKKPWWKD